MFLHTRHALSLHGTHFALCWIATAGEGRWLLQEPLADCSSAALDGGVDREGGSSLLRVGAWPRLAAAATVAGAARLAAAAAAAAAAATAPLILCSVVAVVGFCRRLAAAATVAGAARLAAAAAAATAPLILCSALLLWLAAAACACGREMQQMEIQNLNF